MIRVWFVTDPRLSLERTSAIVREAAAGAPGRFAVQLRAKELGFAEVTRWAHALREVTGEAGAALVLNVGGDGDRLGLARDVAADGVHVPSGADLAGAVAALGRSAYVTTSAHADADVSHAIEIGAHAVLVSPIFATPGKGPPRGTEAIRRAADHAVSKGVHVVGLGGITTENAGACFDAGAAAVAVIRTLADAEDPRRIASLLAGGPERRVDERPRL